MSVRKELRVSTTAFFTGVVVNWPNSRMPVPFVRPMEDVMKKAVKKIVVKNTPRPGGIGYCEIQDNLINEAKDLINPKSEKI
jgi:hypothetical protein